MFLPDPVDQLNNFIDNRWGLRCVCNHADLDFVGAEGISPAVVGTNQDAVFMVIECIIQYGIKIGKRRANIRWQDYPHSIAAAAKGMMILDQFKSVIGYQFVRAAHVTIIT